MLQLLTADGGGACVCLRVFISVCVSFGVCMCVYTCVCVSGVNMIRCVAGRSAATGCF